MNEKPGRNEAYDRLLREMNDWLAPVEAQLTASFHTPKHPVVFIVGPPRSGTTLLAQVLAATGQFTFPSNLVARFYGSLAFAARVQEVLEPILPKADSEFVSNFGRTKEWWEPSEFGFFWERHFPFGDCHELTEEQLSRADADRFVKELAAFEAGTGRPIFLKAILLTYHLSFLHRLVPTALFVRVTRSATYVIQSILLMRRRLFGDFQTWWSIRPRNWRQLAELPNPVEQVAGQVSSVDQALNGACSQIPSGNWVTISYESFCDDTRAELSKLASALAELGYPLDIDERVPASFKPSRSRKVDNVMYERILAMCDRYNLGS